MQNLKSNETSFYFDSCFAWIQVVLNEQVCRIVLGSKREGTHKTILTSDIKENSQSKNLFSWRGIVVYLFTVHIVFFKINFLYVNLRIICAKEWMAWTLLHVFHPSPMLRVWPSGKYYWTIIKISSIHLQCIRSLFSELYNITIIFTDGFNTSESLSSLHPIVTWSD